MFIFGSVVWPPPPAPRSKICPVLHAHTLIDGRTSSLKGKGEVLFVGSIDFQDLTLDIVETDEITNVLEWKQYWKKSKFKKILENDSRKNQERIKKIKEESGKNKE